jgi:hypothetical protein
MVLLTSIKVPDASGKAESIRPGAKQHVPVSGLLLSGARRKESATRARAKLSVGHWALNTNDRTPVPKRGAMVSFGKLKGPPEPPVLLLILGKKGVQ